MKLFISLIPIVLIVTAVQGQVPVGRSVSYPQGIQRSQSGVPIIARSYESSRLASESTRANTPLHDENGLTLYEDFVNDPWKPTEDLGTLLSERSGGRQKQVRAGGQVDARDDIWPQRQAQRYSQPRANPTVPPHQVRSAMHGYGDGNWEVHSQDDNHVTYVQRNMYTPNQLQTGQSATPEARGVESNWRSGAAGSRSGTTHSGLRSRTSEVPHGENGNDDWIVESRSDGHITYRKRIRPGQQRSAGVHGWRNPGESTGIRTLGHGDGQVRARVVNTATDNDDAFASVHSGYNRRQSSGAGAGTRPGLASYKSMRSNYAHEGETGGKSHLQLKSGDHVSYRTRDGNEAVFNRYRQAPTVAPTPAPVQYEQQGDWRMVSKGDSHVTWSRVGSEYDTVTNRPVQHRTGRYYGTGPHYPMMRERAFTERDNRMGSSNVLAV